MKKNIIGLFGFMLLVALDQWTKLLALTTLKLREAFPIIANVFELRYLENRGAAFGIMQNQRFILVIVTVCILLGLLFLFYRIPDKKHMIPLEVTIVLLGAGAVGNMIDRIVRGYVIDFFYFKLINFPIFNVADCYVVIAAVLAVILICFYYSEEDFDFAKRKDTKRN